MFYKDEVHEEQTMTILQTFGLTHLEQNVEYGSLAYIIGATYKGNYFINYINENGSIDSNGLLKKIQVFSSSERNMIKFALQCFNNKMNDITLYDTMYSLDNNNRKIIKEAINLRY